MYKALTRLLPAIFAVASLSLSASATDIPSGYTPVPVGFVSFDVTGANVAQFDIVNLTGGNSSAPGDPSFPVTTAVSFSNLSLTVDYAGGGSQTFDSSYFTLDGDGFSFDGEQLSTLSGAPTGLFGAIDATLTGTFSTGDFTFNDGSQKNGVLSGFNAFISDPSGLQDGDLTVINAAAPIPEPSTWLLMGTGSIGLFGITGLRKFKRHTGYALGIGCALLLLLPTASHASSAVVKLTTLTAPSSGASGVTSVNITGTGFPAGNLSKTNMHVTVAASCGSAGSVATVNSVALVLGSSDKVQILIPASLPAGTYFVSLSGTTSTGNSFTSNCSQVSVVAAAPTATLNVSSITFPSLTAGTTSSMQNVILTNTGTAALNISSIALTGTGANIFSETNNCGASLPTGGYCTINASFSPLVPGTYTAAITLNDDAATTTQAVALSAAAAPAALTIDTTNPVDWKISNGTLNLEYNSQTGAIFSIMLAGHPDQLIDNSPADPLDGETALTPTGAPKGFYMDLAGFGITPTTASYVNNGNYLDWWVTFPSSGSTNAFTYSEHFVVTPNDSGIHMYFVANHSSTDNSGSMGQVQWIYRESPAQFPNVYSVDLDLSNPGPVIVPLPTVDEMFSSDPGREVQDASGFSTMDLHGYTDIPAGFKRQFYVKYDYSTYEYLHKAHGTFGGTYGAWAVTPGGEDTSVGGPTKQNLNFTGNILTLEPLSGHLDNSIGISAPKGSVSSRLFGPFYLRFNTFGRAYTQTGDVIATPDDMYKDAVQSGSSFSSFYDSEQTLVSNGYVASSDRGSVQLQINGVTGAPKTAWAVLSDAKKNFQVSSLGHEYWADISNTGFTTFGNVVPGTYRLSVYVLGKWGELRQDNIVVQTGQPTVIPPVNFVQENFGTTPLFTIGTADRSSHEFLHGHDAAGHDDREFWGNWNYWADFQTNAGAVIYNATDGPAGTATNDLSKWNYVHWGTFSPPLYGGFYSAGDDTTDGYKYIRPGYVASATQLVPAWQMHFATPPDQTGSTASKYAVLSVALAAASCNYIVSLNGKALTWKIANATDASERSGLAGYTQWIAFQWDASILNPPGQDNVITINVSGASSGAFEGSKIPVVASDSDDALRFELTNSSADPAVTGWHDYEYLYNTTDTKPTDTVANP